MFLTKPSQQANIEILSISLKIPKVLLDISFLPLIEKKLTNQGCYLYYQNIYLNWVKDKVLSVLQVG